MKFRNLTYQIIASCVICWVLSLTVIHKPMSLGIVQDYVERKLAYLSAIQGPKIVLLAGSNGRFSHSCATIEEGTGISCVNMSISAGLSIEYQFEYIKPYLREGDILFMPLEYGVLAKSNQQHMSDDDPAIMLAYDHAKLVKSDAAAIVHAMFYPDLRYFISGAGEMLLRCVGVKRRYSADTTNFHGDEFGHAISKSLPYRQFIDGIVWQPPDPESVVDEKSYGAKKIDEVIHWAADHGVIVVGGLPTTIDDSPIPESVVERLRAFFSRRNQPFIVMDNLSQYPRSHFYDTVYHLSEEYQIAHSRKLLPYLSNVLREVSGRSRVVAREHGPI